MEFLLFIVSLMLTHLEENGGRGLGLDWSPCPQTSPTKQKANTQPETHSQTWESERDIEVIMLASSSSSPPSLFVWGTLSLPLTHCWLVFAKEKASKGLTFTSLLYPNFGNFFPSLFVPWTCTWDLCAGVEYWMMKLLVLIACIRFRRKELGKVSALAHSLPKFGALLSLGF